MKNHLFEPIYVAAAQLDLLDQTCIAVAFFLGGGVLPYLGTLLTPVYAIEHLYILKINTFVTACSNIDPLNLERTWNRPPGNMKRKMIV